MKIFVEALDNVQRHPVKSAVTFLSVGIGVGILIFALSLSIRFSQLLDEKINAEGQVLVVSNTELQADGSYDRVRPSQLDLNASSLVDVAVEGIEATAIVTSGRISQLAIDGEQYRVRNAVGSDEGYFDVMGLSLLAGNTMTDDDVNKGSKVMWLSESVASSLFGSAEGSIGQQIQVPSSDSRRGGEAQESRTSINIFNVAGVFKDPDELKREAYGIADILIPYTSMISGDNAQRMLDRVSGTFAIRVVNNPNIEAQIYDLLAQEYGLDLALNTWEGTIRQPSDLLSEVRNSITQISFIINLLGFILLVSGAIGILSIMMVEIIAKKKNIAIERALGASIPAIVRKFLLQSFVLSGLSAVIGIGLAYMLAMPMVEIVMSVFDGVDLTDLTSGLIHPMAILVGTVSALVFGGLFGVLPLIGIVKLPIAEGLRDA